MQRRHGHGIFQRGSNVREYWLAHCEGFAVVGSATRSRVRAVVVDPADGRAHHVVVSGRTSLRTRVLPAERIESVDPFDRVLYAEGRHTMRAVAGTFAHAAAILHVWLRPRLRTAAVSLRTRSREVVAWLLPRLRAAAVSARAHNREVVAWLRPRLRSAAISAERRSREASAWLRPRTARAARRTTDEVRAMSRALLVRLRS